VVLNLGAGRYSGGPRSRLGCWKKLSIDVKERQVGRRTSRDECWGWGCIPFRGDVKINVVMKEITKIAMVGFKYHKENRHPLYRILRPMVANVPGLI